MDKVLLYYVNFKENCEAEGRKFLVGEDYPVYDKGDGRVILCAENGEFNFTKDLMEKVIVEWGLFIKNI